MSECSPKFVTGKIDVPITYFTDNGGSILAEIPNGESEEALFDPRLDALVFDDDADPFRFHRTGALSTSDKPNQTLPLIKKILDKPLKTLEEVINGNY